jgi:glycosyltransferase involved in cell wall biosynthesis
VKEILHLTKGFPPSPGGVEQATEEFCKAAILFNYSVSVIYQGKAKSFKNLNGIKLFSVKRFFTLYGQSVSLKIFWIFLQLSRKANIIHIHSPDYISLICLILGRIVNGKKPFILHWHSDVLNKGILGCLLRPIEWIAVSLATKVIFASPDYFKSSYIKYFIRNKLVIIEYTYNENIYNLKSKNIINQFNNDECLKIVTLCRLVPYKGLKELIFKLHTYKNFQLTIIGDGPILSELQNTIKDLELNHVIKLTGNISAVEIMEIYIKSDVFILSSRNRAEAFGIVLLEAMGAGLPILTFNNIGSGMKHINSNSNYGATYGDSDDILDIAKELLNRTKYKRNEISEMVNQRFGSKIFHEKVKFLYSNIKH